MIVVDYNGYPLAVGMYVRILDYRKTDLEYGMDYTSRTRLSCIGMRAKIRQMDAGTKPTTHTIWLEEQEGLREHLWYARWVAAERPPVLRTLAERYRKG